MWLSKTSFEMCISATAFYATLLASGCGADDIPGGEVWKDDDFVHIYRTAVPMDDRIDFRNGDGNSTAITATVAVLLVLVSAAAIGCLCCCLCWKLLPRNGSNSRRRQSHAALVPPPVTVQVQNNERPDNIRFGRSTSRVGNVYSRGVLNLAFTSNLRDREAEDGPPAYTTVVVETSPNTKSTNSLYVPVGEKQQVETPPPAYCTVAPKF